MAAGPVGTRIAGTLGTVREPLDVRRRLEHEHDVRVGQTRGEVEDSHVATQDQLLVADLFNPHRRCDRLERNNEWGIQQRILQTGAVAPLAAASEPAQASRSPQSPEQMITLCATKIGW